MPIDYSKYPSNWKTEIIPALRERSGNCCELCHLPNGLIGARLKNGSFRKAHFIEMDQIRSLKKRGYSERQAISRMGLMKIVLTGAHLDHDESNPDISLERLKYLCQKCHLNYDQVEKKRRKRERELKGKMQLSI